MKRILLWTGGSIFLGSWLLLLGHFYFTEIAPFGPIISDVSKRLEAPDGKKTALLIRRKTFDLNFLLKVKSGGKVATLYESPDYNTAPSIDWNERIRWSDDSSLLVFSTDAVPPYFGPRMWAFDFRNNVAVRESKTILELLNERTRKRAP
jgi:hypothetical protein